MVSTNTQSELCGSTTTESDATAVLSDILRNYISGGSGNASLMFDQCPENYQYEDLATEDKGSAKANPFPGSSDGLCS